MQQVNKSSHFYFVYNESTDEEKCNISINKYQLHVTFETQYGRMRTTYTLLQYLVNKLENSITYKGGNRDRLSKYLFIARRRT